MDTTPTESQDPQADDSVIVARITGAHGVDGTLRIILLSDLPGRFDAGSSLFAGGRFRAVSSFRPTGPDTGLIRLDGISTRRQANSLSGQYLTARPDTELELDEGEYLHYQLIGMKVRTEEGEELGEIREIIETGSNDVYIVRGEAGEVLIPATAQVVLEVDVVGGKMLVRLPDGLR